MKYLPEADIIVALSSPLGNGAIAVIRVSGRDCLPLINPLLKKALNADDARRARFNEFRVADSGAVVDQVVTIYFKAPASYTGEDLVEINCHCNPLIIERIIGEIVRQGARVAAPGEFTFRAFMNGKLDLSQAEAVAGIINARSRQSLTQSLRHLEGRLSERIFAIREQILGFLALIEISLDFSEEEIEVLPLDELKIRITETIAQIERLLDTYDYGRLLQEGIKLLILGKPNVGKSSLLNALLQRDRAIVSEIPGTTRDYIEASLELDGLAVQAVDTAGIRHTEDVVEAIGVERALKQLESADVALAVFESQRELEADDRALLEIIETHGAGVHFVLVQNKADLGQSAPAAEILRELNLPLVAISAKTGVGIDGLKQAIKNEIFRDSSIESEEVVVTSARHQRALEGTIAALRNALEAADLRASEEIIAVDVRLALDSLGEITGETTSEDVLNHIFANFCIGK